MKTRLPCAVRRRRIAPLAMSALLLAGTLQAAMPTAITQSRRAGAVLTAEFGYDPQRRALRVDYRVRNDGAEPLAVFDRGDRHAVASGRQRAGAVAAPSWQSLGAGDLQLSHVAEPLPRPAPVSPPTPLALKLAPGAQAAGSFDFALPQAQAPQRLRWCLGVARFDPDQLDDPQRYGEVEVWRASFALAQTQQRLCTPWFDLGRGAFVADPAR